MKRLLIAVLLTVSIGVTAQDTTSHKSYKDLSGKWVEPKMQKDEYLEFKDSATLILAFKGFAISVPYTADFSKDPIQLEGTATEFGLKRTTYILILFIDKDTILISMSDEKKSKFEEGARKLNRVK